MTYSLDYAELGSEWIRLAQESVQLRSSAIRARLLAAAPNPFNPTTRIRFDLPQPTRVSLDVFNLAGRKVDTLHRATLLPAGSHEVIWDARDGSGRTLASGVYVCRLVTEDAVQTQRLTLVK